MTEREKARKIMVRLAIKVRRAIKDGSEGGYVTLHLLPKDAEYLASGLSRYLKEGGSLNEAFGLVLESEGRPSGRTTATRRIMKKVSQAMPVSGKPNWKLIARHVGWDKTPNALQKMFARYELDQQQAQRAEQERDKREHGPLFRALGVRLDAAAKRRHRTKFNCG